MNRRKYVVLVSIVVVIAAAIGWWQYRSRVGHDVIMRASGATDCKLPNVFVTIGHDGKATTENADHVELPWQSKTYVQRRGDNINVIVTGTSECSSVQCQILIDGLEKKSQTGPRQVSCEVTID